MGTIEEVKRMQSQGIAEEDIRRQLKSNGLSDTEVSDTMVQAKIKEAVENDSTFPIPKESSADGSQYNLSGMEHSILTTPPTLDEGASDEEQRGSVQKYTPPPVPQQYPQYPTQPQEYAPYQEQEYQPYQPYAGGTSPDLISEIAEQVVSEKLSSLRKAVEKTSEIKTTMETRLNYLDERLKRMEKIIDNLQSSILRKVGDYSSDVSDLKKELIETQKSVSRVLHEKHK